MERKSNLETLTPNYLFVEVANRVKAYSSSNPEKELISLSVGDTSEPIPQVVVEKLFQKSKALGTPEGYKGYGLEEGEEMFREKIASAYYSKKFSKEEIFISDGAICDLGRLLAFFGSNSTIALQDPSYPGYKDAASLLGAKEILLLPCGQSPKFFPEFKSIQKRPDIILFCSPNNPTGYAATFEELLSLVQFAKKSRALLLYDAAYTHFIRDPSCPCSIFDIPGSEEVAIEIHSFSKLIGFTGVRLGWTVIPKTLKYDNGRSINEDWRRFITTIYNGTSLIAQAGGLATLEPDGMQAAKALIEHYLENTSILKSTLEKKGFTVYGGGNAPYLWLDCSGKKSWQVFDEFLQEKGIVTIPGIGFGEEGEGFIRLTGFGNRSKILKAVERINT